MKKFTLALICVNALFAASNEQIAEFYSQSIKAQFPDAKVSVSQRQKVANTGFESVIVSIEVNGQKEEQILFTKDNLVVPDIIDLKAKTSYRQDYEIKKFQEARENFTKNAKAVVEKEEMVIRMGDKNKPAIYVFSDPECPYCREHLKKIKEELKNYQVNYILTPVHGKSAFEKSALIYKETQKAKNDDEKIAILKKYYDEKIKNYPKVSEKEFTDALKLYEKYRSLGLRSVPTIIGD
ncbi:MAG: thioredoxin fold domain-containing protein [Campylobacter sp.]|nr:thioredoxin fold domain-containing protein [Campylobacter sp.]